MEHRTLVITLQYAKHLNKVTLISKMAVYAVVSISGGDKNSTQKTKSPPDHDGGANPTWGFPMKFAVDEAALQQNRLVLDFKLLCHRALGDREVGQVHVPIKELLDHSPANDGKKKFVSYQVRKPNGKPKGQLTFSYQFNEKPNMLLAKVYGKPTAGPGLEYPATTLGGYDMLLMTDCVRQSHESKDGLYPIVGLSPIDCDLTHTLTKPVPPHLTIFTCETVSHETYSHTQEGGGGYYPPLDVYPPPPEYGYQPQPPHGYVYPPPPGYWYSPQPGYGYLSAPAPRLTVVQEVPREVNLGWG